MAVQLPRRPDRCPCRLANSLPAQSGTAPRSISKRDQRSITVYPHGRHLVLQAQTALGPPGFHRCPVSALIHGHGIITRQSANVYLTFIRR